MPLHLLDRSILVALVAFVPFAASARAQAGHPTPSPELRKLEPRIGSWVGSGTFTEPGQTSKWTAIGTYRWVLDNFRLQEDFVITCAGAAAARVIMGSAPPFESFQPTYTKK